MSTSPGIVVVGAGQAGGELVAALRMARYAGSITLVGDEGAYPYSRPPLSKAFLLGTCSVADLRLRPAEFYDEHGINTILNNPVVAVDPAAKTVRFADDTAAEYSSLVLATGGQARRMADPDAERASNVHYLRTVADVESLRPSFTPGRRLTIVGGGYVGLEVASVARTLGLDVTVLEAAPRLLARVTGPELSGFFHRLHTGKGVDVRVQTLVAGFRTDANGTVTHVETSNGSSIPTDLVLIGIGLVPNDELARTSGLAVNNGIVVDEHCRTSDTSIFAIGDCSSHPCAENGGLRRIESVPNASEQARVVAATITGGTRSSSSVPWFWSDQYDLKLQSVGLPTGYDQVVVRSSVSSDRSFQAFYLKAGEIRGADVVSNPRDFGIAKKLVSARARISPQSLGDGSITLKDLFLQSQQPRAARSVM